MSTNENYTDFTFSQILEKHFQEGVPDDFTVPHPMSVEYLMKSPIGTKNSLSYEDSKEIVNQMLVKNIEAYKNRKSPTES